MIRFGRRGRRSGDGSADERDDRRGGRRRGPNTQIVPVTQISPRLTDSEIDNWLDSHVVAVDPFVDHLGKLFLFFCGSYGIPERQQRIIELAASMGYHAINLAYPNSWTVGALCRHSPDPNCHGKIRMEIVDGVKRSHELRLDISRANSIVNRLEKLLCYLHRERPDEGWSAYFDTQGIRWDAVVVSGHSQGGGQAAIIAKEYRLARVVMFAAPVDFLAVKQIHASWLNTPGVTSPERYFGFIHDLDPGVERVICAWKLLGMDRSGPVVNVDRGIPPYGHAQRLISSFGDIRRGRYHAGVVQDGATPILPDGSPQFQPVWRYLLNVEASK